MTLITLMTDFGASSPYVAQMKGVIATRRPEAKILDLTHSIPAQNVLAGAIVLDDLVPWFPAGTVNVCVVDPGVGSDRRILAAAIGSWFFVLPDNGLLSALAHRHQVHQVVALDKPQFWLAEVSRTFHGRDIMSPVAVAISQKIDLRQLGTPVSDWKRIEIAKPLIAGATIRGEVIYVDSFGNLITNISAEDISPEDRFQVEGVDAEGFAQTYSDRKFGSVVALVGSSGRLEFAVVDGSAADQLGVGQGASVLIEKTGGSP